ncbi:MAG: THUMP domain-containing protein [Candidatus Methylarchaceae archaeon HK02M2]|nr:THUMP domain-containing protein [Candidatus Methylarchaceae archaeon HK02M2]
MQEYKVLVSFSDDNYDDSLSRLKHQISTSLELSELEFSNMVTRKGIILLNAEDPVRVADVLSKILGVDYTAVVKIVPSKYDDVIEAITRSGLKLIYPNETFTVRVELKGTLPYSSRDIEFATCARLIGELGEKGVRQDKKDPLKVIYARIEDETACIFFYKYDGPGGIPVGSKGKALCLLSDDNYSAVATWIMARQGIFPYILFFDTRPYVNQSCVRRTITVATLIREFLPVKKYDLIVMKIGFIINHLKKVCPPEYDKNMPFLFKRIIMHIACVYADKVGIDTIVSGENLGQSTLNTFMNSFKITSIYDKQVLFPLIGLIDQEIVDYSKKIGVINFTKESQRDLTKLDEKVMIEVESKLKIKELIDEALSNVVLIDLKNGFNDLHEILNNYPI